MGRLSAEQPCSKGQPTIHIPTGNGENVGIHCTPVRIIDRERPSTKLILVTIVGTHVIKVTTRFYGLHDIPCYIGLILLKL